MKIQDPLLIFRYSAGQHFGRHIDESADLEDGKRTYYTLLIYLSGGNTKSKSKSNSSNTSDSSSAEPLLGGETVFYGSRNSIVAEVINSQIGFFVLISYFIDISSTKTCLSSQVAPVEGMALFHIHGDKCMLHEGRNVSKGVKYVFRSDVVFA